MPIPPNPDQELYDYMAWSALEQGGLYRNAGDVNMPGEAMRHIAAMMIFGNHYWSYRMLDYLLLVGATAVVALLTRKYYGKLYAGLFFGLYLIVYTTSGYWMSGQRDLLATHGIVLAGFAYLRRVEGGHALWLIVAAVALAESVLLKPTYLLYGPLLPVAVGLFVRRDLKAQVTQASLLAAAGAVVLGSVVALDWATDSLKDWYEMTVVFSSQNYVGGTGLLDVLGRMSRTVIISWHWYTLMALSGLFCLMFERLKSPLAVIFAAMATVLVSTFVQRKGFEYHFAGLLVVISLLSAFYLAEILRLAWRIPNARLRYSVLSFPMFLLLSGLLSKGQREFLPQIRWYCDRSQYVEMLRSRSFDDVMAASAYARSATRPGDTVWTYSAHVMINSLADRPIPTRFANYAFLRARKISPLEDRWRREVESVIRDRPPKFIVLQTADPPVSGDFFCMNAIRPDEPISALKEALDRSYVLDRQIGRFAFFRRSTSRVPGANDAPGSSATDRPSVSLR